ncbi:MAG: hypothetical protein QOJ63_2403 [Solirubrobacteraceae bacterium]|jgi:uncharacterized protein (TIGR00369 family)|nr:hypothetical protein [Solirubrobacteraceae bacterium]
MSEEETATTGEQTRTRVITWADPLPYVRRGMAMRPLDYLSDMVHGRIPLAPIAELMGMVGLEIEEGRAVMAAEPAEFHHNPLGVVHGGLAATLLDSTMALAVHSTLPPGGHFSTLELHVNFVRAIRSDGGRIACEAKVVHAGSKIATAEGRITDSAGRLVAHGTCTCMVFRPEPPPDKGA